MTKTTSRPIWVDRGHEAAAGRAPFFSVFCERARWPVLRGAAAAASAGAGSGGVLSLHVNWPAAVASPATVSAV